MKINIFCGSKNRFQVLSDILTRKKGIVIEYSDRPAANAVNIGFACSQELVGLQRASCVTAYEGGYIVEGTEAAVPDQSRQHNGKNQKSNRQSFGSSG